MEELLDFTNFFSQFDLTNRQIAIFSDILAAIIVLAVAVLSFYFTRFVVQRLVKAIIAKTKTEYDDILIKERVFDSISHIVPAIIIYIGIQYVTPDENLIRAIRDLTYVYLVLAILAVIFKVLNALNEIYEIFAKKRNLTIQIKQYLQVFKIIFSIAGAILIFSILLHKKPGAILAGLGAMTAVLLLVFKDSIMSLVASIQISAYKLVKVGDWITIPSKQVDGNIMDISLNTIQIRNFDKTVSTIPTYTLIQEPFVNWQGMVDSGGRRIKRSIYIDMNSIQLCTAEMIEKFKKINFISEYVTKKQEEIDKWNKERNIDPPIHVNGKAQTNLGVFRKYIENYLKSNFRELKKYKKEKFATSDDKTVEYFVIDDPEEFKKELGPKVEDHLDEVQGKTVIRSTEKFLIHFPDKYKLENNYLYKIEKEVERTIVKGTKIEIDRYHKIPIKKGLFCDDLTLIVRQLKPEDKGVPLEIYVFAASTKWGEYEKIQSDLFDHIFAVLPEFKLKVFQQPSSNDFHEFIKTGADGTEIDSQ